MEVRNFEADFELTLEAARRTLAKHPRITIIGFITSPYGSYLGPLALMMRQLHQKAPYTWDEIAKGMVTRRETLDEAMDEIKAELNIAEKQRIYAEFESVRRSMLL